MESQPQNPKFGNNPESILPMCLIVKLKLNSLHAGKSSMLLLSSTDLYQN